MARIVCLANSKRPDGRCIAGIDLQTGEWIRPVPRDSDAVPDQRCFVDGRFLSVLDVVEIDVARFKQVPPYQCENRVIRNWNWAILRRFPRASLPQYCDQAVPILHSANDWVLPSVLDALPATEWKSLQLVRPSRLSFERDARDQHRWRARFRVAKGNEYALKVTDPEATRRLEAGDRIGANCLLTISLTKPWAPPSGTLAERCYKLVAAVIEL